MMAKKEKTIGYGLNALKDIYRAKRYSTIHGI
jgi:hypothetical protein